MDYKQDFRKGRVAEEKRLVHSFQFIDEIKTVEEDCENYNRLREARFDELLNMVQSKYGSNQNRYVHMDI